MKTWRLALVIFEFAVLSLSASGADWPQWRGPERNGISKETGLLKEWPEGGPKLVWHLKEIGDGYSTPAVVGDRVYVLSNHGLDDEFVQALSTQDGKPIWSKRLGKVGNPMQRPSYPAARSTPTIDGDVLYALSSDGDLACVEIADGNVRWQKSIRKDFGGHPGVWAYSESPLVDGDAVVCSPGGRDAGIVALNKKNGELIWKSDIGGDQAGYASVVIDEAGGLKQYVQFMQKGVVGVDAKSGKLLWRYDKTAKGSPANIPTPVIHADYVYTATGRSGAGLVKLTVNGPEVKADEVYFKGNLPTSIGGSLVLGENLYGTNAQGLMCVELATGNIRWQDRGVGAGSLCSADGRLYVHGEGNNAVALVEATSDGYHEKGRVTPPGSPNHGGRQPKAWAYPVVANGRLYIRDREAMWCYDITTK